MNLEEAIRITEILLAVAFLQQSLEHMVNSQKGRILFCIRIILSFFLLFGFQTQWVCLVLIIVALFTLKRFNGPYNGGSDRMSLLILCSVTLAHFMTAQKWQEVIFGYLALQVVLSYFMAGWVKVINPDWRNGRALQDVFRFSIYPVSESLRGWAERPKLLCLISWAVMLFELGFPFTLLTQPLLLTGLVVGAAFHLANACLFGLNRFFWIWIAAYPSLLWFQGRLL